MIWVVGANGMLGRELSELLSDGGQPWTGTDRNVDFTNPADLEAFGRGKSIEWVVNCAAYTAVDRAEDEPELCRRLNVDGPANLARWSQSHGAGLIHISTDYVFSGRGTRPYVEDDPIGPTGVYGQTKADGESAVRSLCDRHYILRTAWLYGAHGPNFVYTMLRLMAQRETLGVVADQKGAPTWARDLARLIVELTKTEEHPGTYHASGEGVCSWHEFAETIRDEAQQRGLLDPGRRVVVEPLTTAQYPTKATRPTWSVLSKEKLRSTFGASFPAWRESLGKFLSGPHDRPRFQF